ncbi:amino acid adenylation domain protein [Kribbella flavida DSM 17836]|uniref:Phenyloxazoline synthase MbtB n=1 Tax=Kribbella flavida (strain DSM 17836 / JCM 10339 / NBRC 14399) TaxID=479435 RepID=D2PSP7_KRIFD|nr:non-ribosomal peptide synthetase [Kribbella flavida]ADB33185.1 amino acid adenylation domain protein [Kribbella flavida DSM 17836]
MDTTQTGQEALRIELPADGGDAGAATAVAAVEVPLPGGLLEQAAELTASITGGPAGPQPTLRAAWAALMHRYSGAPALALVTGSGEATGCLSFDFVDGVSFRQVVDAAAGPPEPLLIPGDIALFSAGVCEDGVTAGAVPAELVLSVTSEGAAVNYRTAGFSAEAASRIAAQFVALLISALHDPYESVRRLQLLPADERSRLLVDWNDTSAAYRDDVTIADLVHEQAQQDPDIVAIEAGPRRWTYGELDRDATALAAMLQQAGLRRGARVAVLIERSAECIIGFLAVVRAGATAVLLDPENPDARLTAVLDDAAVAGVITRRSLWHRLAAHHAVVALCVDDPDTSPRLDGGAVSDEAGVVFYTSGSTGEPKGVLIRHRAFANMVEWSRTAYGISTGDRAAWASSPGFAIAAQEWITLLGLGVTVCVAAPDTAGSPQALRDWILAERITVAVLVAPMAERLWWLTWPSEDVPLRYLFATGAPVRRWAPADVPFEPVVFHATTETLVTTSCLNVATGLRATSKGLPAHARRRTPLPVGKPIANTRAYLLDEAGHPVPTGVIGELHIAGAGLALGYLGKPELTSERFVRHSVAEEADELLYRTGDLARFRADGLVEMVGRADLQTKVRGFRVEPEAVESALESLTEVREAAVAARPDATGEVTLIGYVVAEPGTGPGIAARIKEELGRLLPAYMVPTSLVLLEALPRLTNGKLDRKSLPVAPTTVERPYVAPRTETERTVAGIWADVLGVDKVGVDDLFLELGGHSLAAIDVTSRLRDAFGTTVGLHELYSAGTVAGVAEILAAGGRSDGEGRGDLPVVVSDPAARHSPFPLTDTQYAYWIGRGDAVELGNVGCHGYFEWQSDDLDSNRLKLAWDRLVQRHEALRLVMLPDGTQQVLADPPPYEVEVLDLSEHAPEDAERIAGELRERLAHHVFSVDEWPFFDVRVTHLPEGQVRLHLSFDLLICDAWSYVQLLIPELVLFYEDPGLELEPLELTFRDYVLGTDGALTDSPAYEASRTYWLDRIDALPPAPDLPLTASRAEAAPTFSRRADRLEPDEWTLLQQQANRRGVTPTCLLITTFAEVLRTWSKSDRFTINCPLFNRLPVHPQVHDIVGDFTTTSLLAVEPTGGSFAGRARAVQQRMWEDLEHRHFGGIQVMRELAARERDRVRASFPVVVTSLLGQPPRRTATAIGESVYSISQTPQVSIDFQIWEDNGALTYNWDSLDALYPDGMLDDMFEAHRGLVRWLLSDERHWEDEPPALLPQWQRTQRDEINNAARKTLSGPSYLHTPLAEHARRTPDAPAVITLERTISYAELDVTVNRLGRLLRAAGAVPNRLVAIHLDKGWQQIAAAHGILASGAAYLPMDAAWPVERLHRLVDQAEIELVVTHSALVDGAQWPAHVRVVCVDRDLEDGDAQPLEPVQQPADLAYVIFTSGSTGTPKGVMVDHRGALNTIVEANLRFRVGPDDRCFAVSPLHFDLSVYDVFGMTQVGGAVAVPGPMPFPPHWLELMKKAGVTFWNSVPTLMEMAVSEAEAAGTPEAFAPLRTVVLAGDWIPLPLPDRIRALNPRTSVISSGGPAETCIWSVIYPIDEVDPEWTSIPYGKPMANQRYHVLAADLSHRPTWVPGEIYTASEVGLAQGYWGDPELTARKFVELPSGGRAYASGDLGRYLPDGNIEILGREDFQVKIRGVRIELGEVEAAVRSCPGVDTAVVVAGGTPGESFLHAYVVWATGQTGDLDRLREHLTGILPGYMLPHRITVLDELPLTRNAKVDRLALIKGAAGETVAPVPEFVPAVTPVEQVICALFAEVLGREQAGLSDDFFVLGGNSLTAVRLVTLLAEILGPQLSIQQLFTARTVEAVVSAVLADPICRPEVEALATALLEPGTDGWNETVPTTEKDTSTC